MEQVGEELAQATEQTREVLDAEAQRLKEGLDNEAQRISRNVKKVAKKFPKTLGAGAIVDEHELAVLGLRRRVRYKEAITVLEMEDAARAAWYQGNPAVQTALEYMITTADNRVSGHIGYSFVVSEGDHKQVARSLAEML